MGNSNVQTRPEGDIEVTLRQYAPHRIISSRGIIGRPQVSQRHDQPGPTRLVFMTSARDVAKEDKNGLVLNNRGQPHYMMGLIEAVNDIINEERTGLEKAIQINGIITDDIPEDHLDPYPLTPKRGKPWIHRLDARDSKGELLTKNTHHIPSDFRHTTPRKDREAERKEFEEEVYKISQQMGADILVSDHFMLRIVHLIGTNRYSIGRVLNIHPGISDIKNPRRLPGSTPTQDAIDSVRYGCIYDKKIGLYLPTQPRLKTGASLHVIDEDLDTGPVIADSESTPVFASDDPQSLRIRNYPVKIAVFVVGIMHYVQTMLDEVDKLNFKSGEIPDSRKTTVTTRDFTERI